jgi:hypothetical protein
MNHAQGPRFEYLEERFRPQVRYFDDKARFNQSRYLLMRRMMLVASWLTPISIFIQFTIHSNMRDAWAIVPMILSTIAVGSYQWEEQHNYGSQWSKFRLVAENLKHQLVYFENQTGPSEDFLRTMLSASLSRWSRKLLRGPTSTTSR